jgi:methionine-gamma-lyase
VEDSKSQNLKAFYLDCGFGTRCLHAGEHVGQPQHASHVGAIYQTSTFVFDSAQQGADLFAGQQQGYIYTRLGNPTVMVLEAKINALEGGDLKRLRPDVRVSTLAFSSGMAAIATTLLAVASAGDTVILGDVVYGATEHLAFHVLDRFGVRAVEVDTSDLDAVDRVIRENPKAKAILFETPTNPMMAVSDIAEVCRIVRAVNPSIRVAVDNTFATPYLQRPLEFGADIVLHSTTKYIGGHGAVVGGLMTTVHEDVKAAAYTLIKDVGGVPSPFDAWITNMGLKTLPLRMDRHSANAMAVARFLEGHPKVERVFYPGLESSPYHALARRQMKDFGGMVSCEIRGGVEAGRRLMDNIRIFTLAVSLGCVDSLIQHPASMTHACVPKAKREKGGVTDGLVRISVGIEDVDDLLRALDEGLAKV